MPRFAIYARSFTPVHTRTVSWVSLPPPKLFPTVHFRDSSGLASRVSSADRRSRRAAQGFSRRQDEGDGSRNRTRRTTADRGDEIAGRVENVKTRGSGDSRERYGLVPTTGVRRSSALQLDQTRDVSSSTRTAWRKMGRRRIGSDDTNGRDENRQSGKGDTKGQDEREKIRKRLKEVMSTATTG